jgi:hypothetical protein
MHTVKTPPVTALVRAPSNPAFASMGSIKPGENHYRQQKALPPINWVEGSTQIDHERA